MGLKWHRSAGLAEVKFAPVRQESYQKLSAGPACISDPGLGFPCQIIIILLTTLRAPLIRFIPESRLRNFEVLVGDEGPLGVRCSLYRHVLKSKLLSVRCQKSKGRFVTIRQFGLGNQDETLELCEVKVYGYLDTCNL